MLSARALLMLIVTVSLLIVGLLGMHALSGSGGHTSGHGGVAIAVDPQHEPAAVSQHAQHEHRASGPEAADCSSTCEHDAPAAPGHAELAACVLALLAGLIVLVPPARVARWSAAETAMPRAPAVVSAVLLVPPPPSLTLLSISRT